MSQLIEDRLQQGRDAYRRHVRHEAFDLLCEADSETPLSPEDLGLLAESAWFAGDPDAAIEARERAHAGYLEQDDKCQAAAMALELGLDHFERLEAAIGNGWLGRAKRLLEQTPKERAAHGWQALSLAYLARRLAGSEEEALRQARLAQGIGERLAIPAIQALALQQQGYALVAMGRVDDGLALIDESTVAAVSGELDPLTTGRIYCSTISVCRDLADWRRAVEWTDAAERWCRQQGVSGFPGICRVHRAEIASARVIDFVGRGVHEAARIGSLAGGGQILASVNTVQSAATRFPISTPRSVTLKGVSDPVDVVTIEWIWTGVKERSASPVTWVCAVATDLGPTSCCPDSSGVVGWLWRGGMGGGGSAVDHILNACSIMRWSGTSWSGWMRPAPWRRRRPTSTP